MEKIRLAETDHVIEIERANVQLPDQELLEFAREVWEGVVRAADQFGARPGQIFVRAIFRDQVIVLDDGVNQHIRLDMRRGKDGGLTFKNPIVVRQEWIEQGPLNVERSDEDTDEKVERSYLSVKRVPHIWRDVVGLAV